jgi:ketosteroid isomerase-like protein
LVVVDGGIIRSLCGRRCLKLTFPDVTIAVAGNAAIVRHIYASESEAGGKTDNIRLSVLAVWQKQDGDWKLLARQGYKPT